MFVRPLIGLLLAAAPWDLDTLRMEREACPGIHEVLAGSFTRHSREYYEWCIEDRRRRPAEMASDPQLLDDLALACDRTGRTQEAIRLMRESEKIYPTRFETLANLGTYLLHAGRLEEGVGLLREAVALNPDAHFANEIVAICVADYRIAARRDHGTALPLRAPESRRGFLEFLRDFEPALPNVTDNHLNIVEGLVGMLLYGVHDDPVVAECLGDVLRELGHRRLAARAYLLASYGAGDSAAAERYRILAEIVLRAQTTGGVRGRWFEQRVTVDDVEERFEREREDGRELAARIAADEARWRAEGLDLDAEFARKYGPLGKLEEVSLPIEWERAFWWTIGITVGFLILRLHRNTTRNRWRARERKRAKKVTAGMEF